MTRAAAGPTNGILAAADAAATLTGLAGAASIRWRDVGRPLLPALPKDSVLGRLDVLPLSSNTPPDRIVHKALVVQILGLSRPTVGATCCVDCKAALVDVGQARIGRQQISIDSDEITPPMMVDMSPGFSTSASWRSSILGRPMVARYLLKRVLAAGRAA